MSLAASANPRGVAAMADLPPLLALSPRGLAATIRCVPPPLLPGYARRFRHAFDRWVPLRASSEAISVIRYVVAPARNPLANIMAIAQVAPLSSILGVAMLRGERIEAVRRRPIGLGFAGAVPAAHPEGYSGPGRDADDTDLTLRSLLL